MLRIVKWICRQFWDIRYFFQRLHSLVGMPSEEETGKFVAIGFLVLMYGIAGAVSIPDESIGKIVAGFLIFSIFPFIGIWMHLQNKDDTDAKIESDKATLAASEEEFDQAMETLKKVKESGIFTDEQWREMISDTRNNSGEP